MDTLKVDYEKTQINVTVPLNGEGILEMYASSSFGQIGYRWNKYDPENDNANVEGWVEVDGETASSLHVENVLKQEIYRCWMDDGNSSLCVEFIVSVDLGIKIDSYQQFDNVKIGDQVEMIMIDESSIP